jgi:hypothetical protein
MRQPLWKLFVLSILLSVVLGLVHTRPAMALLYFCVSGDPCTEEVIFSESISCPRGTSPICVRHYDSNCCVVAVTAEGCGVNPPPYADCPYTIE